MLSKEDQEKHVKKGLCFKCYQAGHRSFECPTFKRRTATIEVVQEEDDEEDCEPSNEEAPRI